MKIHTGEYGETLIQISQKYNIDLQKLHTINQHIPSPIINVFGYKIYIPSPDRSHLKRQYLSECTLPSPLEFLVNWIPLTPLEKMAEIEYDVLVVGSGAGGGAVLSRLCEQWGENEKRVGMIEAGNLLIPTQARNLPTMNAKRFDEYFLSVSTWTGKELPNFSGARQLYALGGRTLFWGMAAPRMPLSETIDWPVPEKEIEFYYTIAEEMMHVTNDYAKGSSIQEILLKRLRENKFPDAEAVPTAIDLEPTKYGEIHSDVVWSSISMLSYALNRKSFDLAVNARAVQILVENGKAVGLKVISPDKKPYILKAKNIVLSTGTLENPRLLLNSGIKGKAIGHYLTNHSFIAATGKINRNEFPEVLGTLTILVPQKEQRPIQIQIGGPGGYDQWYHWYQPYEVKPLLDELLIGIIGFGKVESRFENYVTLDPYKRDEYGVPEIQVNFSYNEKDQEIIRQMVDVLNEVASAMGTPLISRNGQPTICLMPPGSDYHETGTCRMGIDPSTSATNRYGQIHGVPGLYVADNSILPSVGAANPTLTTVALSIRIADYIINQLR